MRAMKTCTREAAKRRSGTLQCFNMFNSDALRWLLLPNKHGQLKFMFVYKIFQFEVYKNIFANNLTFSYK